MSDAAGAIENLLQAGVRCIALLSVACLAAVSALGCGGDPPHRNVVFILAEDQGEQLGALGTPGLETPRLDGLAERGVLFTRAYTPYPVCSAAKASIYTGRWPNGHGLLGNTANFFKPAAELTDDDRAHPLFERSRIQAGVPTLIEVLDDAGFTTAVTHKLHVLPVEKLPYDVRVQKTTVESVDALVTELAASDRPFFLMLNVKGSHRPFRDSEHDDIGVDPGAVRLPGHLPDTPVVRRDWAEYLDSIERTDQIVGAALDALMRAGVSNDTLVVFTSDHGPAFQRGKLALHDLGTHVPAIVAGPGVVRGVRSDALVSHVDWMPTILDWLGLGSEPGPEPGFDGRSLLPLLEGERDPAPRAFVFSQIDHEIQQHDRGMRERSVQDGDWRLIWRDDGRKPRTFNADLWRKSRWRNLTYEETIEQRSDHPDAFRRLRQVDTRRLRGVAPPIELYDLSRDPDELVNRAQDPAAQAERARLLDALRQWMQETGDPAAPLLPAS